jgi:tetratricopeptide (TPR) repeat protein
MDQSERASDTSNRRLDSWTEIGAFFNRDEPTVRRWAKTRSLPVHRVPGQSAVYAFTDELSQWLKTPEFIEAWSEETPPAGQDTPSEEIPFQEDASQARKLPKSWLMIAGMVAVVGIAGVLLIYFRNSSHGVKGANTHGSGNPKAVDLYLKGKYEWTKRTPEGLNKAVDYYTQATVLDPKYAEAYAGLADTYNLLREYTPMPDHDAFPKAMAAAKTALELDDSLAEAHRALAFDSFYWAWDFAGGEREFKRAIELNPNDAVSHHWYATSLLVLGRFHESLSEIERARQIDPTSPSILADRAAILSVAHPIEAAAELKQIEKDHPEFLSPRAYLASISLERQDYRTYLAESKKAATLMNSRPAMEIFKAAEKGYASGGGKGLLENVRQTQEKLYAQGEVPAYDLARTCALLGRNEDAMRYLKAEFDQHDPRIVSIRIDYALRGLHNDPAFINLIARIGLPPL